MRDIAQSDIISAGPQKYTLRIKIQVTGAHQKPGHFLRSVTYRGQDLPHVTSGQFDALEPGSDAGTGCHISTQALHTVPGCHGERENTGKPALHSHPDYIFIFINITVRNYKVGAVELSDKFLLHMPDNSSIDQFPFSNALTYSSPRILRIRSAGCSISRLAPAPVSRCFFPNNDGRMPGRLIAPS